MPGSYVGRCEKLPRSQFFTRCRCRACPTLCLKREQNSRCDPYNGLNRQGLSTLISRQAHGTPGMPGSYVGRCEKLARQAKPPAPPSSQTLASKRGGAGGFACRAAPKSIFHTL